MTSFPETAHACATCFGAKDAAATQGMNKAIMMMLGVTGGVMSGFISAIVTFKRRAKKYAESLARENKLEENPC